MHGLIEYLGWAATAVFVGSYLCRSASALKRVQMVGALMWVCYGLLIGATPVIAANVLVFGAAAWALTRSTPVTSGRAEGAARPKAVARSAWGWGPTRIRRRLADC